jgi:hypothetical protein
VAAAAVVLDHAGAASGAAHHVGLVPGVPAHFPAGRDAAGHDGHAARLRPAVHELAAALVHEEATPGSLPLLPERQGGLPDPAVPQTGLVRGNRSLLGAHATLLHAPRPHHRRLRGPLCHGLVLNFIFHAHAINADFRKCLYNHTYVTY